jgi:hypothetical protein
MALGALMRATAAATSTTARTTARGNATRRDALLKLLEFEVEVFHD